MTEESNPLMSDGKEVAIEVRKYTAIIKGEN